MCVPKSEEKWRCSKVMLGDVFQSDPFTTVLILAHPGTVFYNFCYCCRQLALNHNSVVPHAYLPNPCQTKVTLYNAGKINIPFWRNGVLEVSHMQESPNDKIMFSTALFFPKFYWYQLHTGDTFRLSTCRPNVRLGLKATVARSFLCLDCRTNSCSDGCKGN